MKKHPVVISSNKANRYSFRMLTSGGDLERFKSNPILLYAHRRPSFDHPKLMPIGKIHDIRLSGEQIIGDMEFDQDDEFAIAVEKKWEKGMLNAVSIGAEIVATSEDPSVMLPGQKYPTVTEWILEEVSVADIPADSDAVAIRLHHKGEPSQTITLSEESTFDPSKLFPTTKPKSDMKLIALAFAGQKLVSVAKDANEDQIAEAVTQLVAKANESVELSAQITQKDAEIAKLKDEKQKLEDKAVTDKAENLVQLAVDAKKITPAQKDEYVELAKTNYETVEKILGSMKGFASLSHQVDLADATAVANAKLYAELSYKELDQKGMIPQLKKDNPELFKAKFKERYKADYSGTDLG